MELIFIHGPAAVGKLTVARELSRQSGRAVFHNHLVVDALLAVFEFGSQPFVRLRERMWLDVFKEAAQTGTSLIFTFAPDATVNPDFISKTVRIVEECDGKVLFVKLTCAEHELENRVGSESRKEFRKLRSVETMRKSKLMARDQFPPLPDSGLSIDTTDKSPSQSASLIGEFFRLSSRPHLSQKPSGPAGSGVAGKVNDRVPWCPLLK